MTADAPTIWDSVAVLTLFDAVNKYGSVDGNLKAQKIVFLAELAGQHKAIKIAHFRFFRYTYGPFSRFLADHVGMLERVGALTRGRALTKKGEYIRDYAKDAYIHSGDAILAEEIIRSTARRFGAIPGTQLKKQVYELTVPVVDLDNRKLKVKNISTGLDIIDPARDHESRSIDPFDEDTREELAAELNMAPSVLDPDSPSFRRTISEALKRVQIACS